ncbi:MAG: ABC transporter ATP-binding protein [Desulfobacterales bacterium]|jgi:NitT/TauT family transport system ATP-binding protein
MLKVSGLYKHFGDLVVLENFNLTVSRRGFTILIGPSGCGKSTLFNVLTGVFPREGGDIFWLEKSLPHLGKNAAYMQQKDLLLPWFTLLDNALLPAMIAGWDMVAANTKAQKLFNRLGLNGFENYLPAETSGGMRQRCALVRTLMFAHELVLLDEPLSALDAITRSSLQSLLVLLQSEFNKSILMITHNIDEALMLADEVLVMGKLPMRILEHYKLSGPKPRRLNNPELIDIKEHALSRLQDELEYEIH